MHVRPIPNLLENIVYAQNLKPFSPRKSKYWSIFYSGINWPHIWIALHCFTAEYTDSPSNCTPYWSEAWTIQKVLSTDNYSKLQHNKLVWFDTCLDRFAAKIAYRMCIQCVAWSNETNIFGLVLHVIGYILKIILKISYIVNLLMPVIDQKMQ